MTNFPEPHPHARLIALIVAALFVLVFTHLLVTQGVGR